MAHNENPMKKHRVVVLGGLPIATIITQVLLEREDVELLGVVLCKYNSSYDPWDIEPLDWFAAKHRLPVWTMDELCQQHEPGSLDIALSCRFSKIMRNPFIRLFKNGVVNLHGGLLPEYGGLYSACHTLLNNEKIGGGTIHYITDEKIDTGEIIQRVTFNVSAGMTALEVFQKTQQALLAGVLENLDALLAGTAPRIAQDSYVAKGHPKRYFNAGSLNKQIEINELEKLVSHATACDFPGHERAYFADTIPKVYCTTAPVHRLEQQLASNRTPLVCLDLDTVDLRVKLDALYPLVWGGNKARKIEYICKYALENGCNAIVTNGAVQSNHARATALFAAEKGLKCALVLHTEQNPKDLPLTGNYLLSRLSCADISFCRKTDLSRAMDEAMARLREEGYNPLYVWGGGHSVQGTQAYYDAATEAQEQCGDWIPDYVIVASGTGTTQAGLVAGYAHLPTRVIGVSVARPKQRGADVVLESVGEFGRFMKRDFSRAVVDFRDDWLEGGYEQTSDRLYECIQTAARQGLILDPTYTGKAFLGLQELIGSGEIPVGSKVLFWHTGGLLNLMAAEYPDRRGMTG